MDIYTTCITLGELTHPALSPSSSFEGSRDGTAPPPAQTAGQPSVSASSDGNGQDSTTERSSGSHRNSSSTDSTAATTTASGAQSAGATGGAGSNNAPGTRSSIDLNDAMHRLCVDAMAAHQCLVSFTPVELDTGASAAQGGAQQASQQQQQQQSQQIGQSGQQGGAGQAQQQQQQQSPGRKFNFHLSGGYQQVMSARGSLLRDNPFKVSCRLTLPDNSSQSLAFSS